MPKKEQIPQGGTKLPKKPMPKQDKGGGINLTAEGARGVLQAASSGATKRRLVACRLPSLARSQHAGNPRLRGKGKCGKEFGVTPCKQTINML